MILNFRLNYIQDNGNVNKIDYLLSKEETEEIKTGIIKDMLVETEIVDYETDNKIVVLEVDTTFKEKNIPYIILSFIIDLFPNGLSEFCNEKGIKRKSKTNCINEFMESGYCWSILQQYADPIVIQIKLDRLFMFFDYMIRNNKEDSNIQKKIKKKCGNLGLDLINGRPYIRAVELTDEQQQKIDKVAYAKSENNYFCIKVNDYNKIFDVKKYEKNQYSIIYYRSEGKKVNFCKNLFYEIRLNNNDKENNKKSKTKVIEPKDVRNYNLNSVCNLYRDLIHNRKAMSFIEFFGLFSNVLYMNVRTSKTEKIGKNYLLDIMKKYYSDEVVEGWKKLSDYMKRTLCRVMTCGEYCLYAKECTHLSTLLETVTIPPHSIIKNKQDESYIELDVLQKEIKEYIEEIFETFENNKNPNLCLKPMYLIKAGTGTHKTTIAMQIAIEHRKSIQCIYAVDTTELKYQVQNDFLKQGFTDFIMTPDLGNVQDKSLKRKIKQYQLAGKFITLNNILEQLVEDNKENHQYTQNDIDIIENYLTVNKKLQDDTSYKDKLILTTHKRLPFLKQAKNRLVIIDEDIFGSNFYEYVDIPIRKIKELCNESDIVKEKLQGLVRVIDKLEYYEQHSVIPVKKQWWDSDLRAIIENEIKVKETGNINVFNLFDCISVKRLCNDKDRMKNKEPVNDELDYARCYIRRKLPHTTTIVLSASLEIDFYKQRFTDFLIEEKIFEDVKYKNPVIQLTSNTYSRDYIKHNMEKVREIIEECIFYDMNVITFKKVIEENMDLFESIKLYDNYYAVQGKNEMAGQNLRLIGKPTKDEGYYMFLTSMIYGKNYSRSPSMHNQIVSYEGYLFYVFTYDDDNLRKIHLWDMTSQQEQAIGRARPIENEVDIELYSCVPVKQSILDNIDKDSNIEEIEEFYSEDIEINEE